MTVFNQVFVDREYGCTDHLRDPQLIIDLGANVGYSSAFFCAASQAARSETAPPSPDTDESCLGPSVLMVPKPSRLGFPFGKQQRRLKIRLRSIQHCSDEREHTWS